MYIIAVKILPYNHKGVYAEILYMVHTYAYIITHKYNLYTCMVSVTKSGEPL